MMKQDAREDILILWKKQETHSSIHVSRRDSLQRKISDDDGYNSL